MDLIDVLSHFQISNLMLVQKSALMSYIGRLIVSLTHSFSGDARYTTSRSSCYFLKSTPDCSDGGFSIDHILKSD